MTSFQIIEDVKKWSMGTAVPECDEMRCELGLDENKCGCIMNPEKPIPAWTWEDASALSVFLRVRLLYCNVSKYNGMPCNITWETTLKTRHPHNLIPTKSVLKNMPKVSQKTPKPLQRTTQMDQKSCFSVSGGAHWTLRGKDVSKMTPKWCPGAPQRDPFGVRNRHWRTKRRSKTKKNTSFARRLENLTKKYRNPSLTNLKMYGFV